VAAARVHRVECCITGIRRIGWPFRTACWWSKTLPRCVSISWRQYHYCVEVLMRLRSFQFQEVINLQLQRLRHHLQVTVAVSVIFIEDLVHHQRFWPIPILHHSLWLQAVWQQDLELLNVVSLKHPCIQRLHCKSSLTYMKTVLPESKDSPSAQRSSTKRASSTPRQLPV